MTTNRINHTGHNHPNTPAARAACRKSMASASIDPAVAGRLAALNMALRTDGAILGARTNRKTAIYRGEESGPTTRIDGQHCQQCGTPDQANRFNDGYSSCCNEGIVFTCDPTDCYHR